MTSMSGPQERLREYLFEQARHLAGDVPMALYHYTSAEGMKAILRSGTLRAYNLGQMNDTAEARYAVSVMRAHIDRRFAVEANPDALELFAVIRQQFGGVQLPNLFVLSFTTDCDEPGMWRLYADRGRGFGFAIPTAKAVSWAGDTHNGLFLKCSYDCAVLSKLCEQALDKILRIYLADIKAGVPKDAIPYAVGFLESVSWFAPGFKPDAWRDEKEWRFVFMWSDANHQRSHDGRTFIALSLAVTPENPTPIVAVCAGPDCDYLEGIAPIQQLLNDKGHHNLPIHVSRLHLTRPGRQPPLLNPMKSAPAK